MTALLSAYRTLLATPLRHSPLPAVHFLCGNRACSTDATEDTEPGSSEDLVTPFLTAVGGKDLAKFADKFSSLDELLRTKSRKLNEYGIDCQKRKLLLKRVEQFKQEEWAP